MSQSRRPMSNKTRKEIEKEVKKGQKALTASEEVIRTDELVPSKAIKKYPKVNEALIESTVKGMEVKKAKSHSKQSKRTTPGEVGHSEAATAHSKRENERWEKIVDVKSKGKGKALAAKLQKRNSKNGK